MTEGNLEMALRYHEKAAQLDPEFCDADLDMAIAHFGLGNVYLSKQLFRNSLNCLYTLSQAFPNLKLVWEHEL